jgi:hypothetical protein
MKTLISEDNEKIVYLFSHNNESKEVEYIKKCFIFFDDQQVDFDEISNNDLKNWIEYVQSSPSSSDI